jgi:hypothetical protein
VAKGWDVPDRSVIARGLGGDLPDMVEQWTKEHDRFGDYGLL